MVAWVLYLTGVGVVMTGAALVAEPALRRLGVPVRWAWVAAMAGSVLIPAVRVFVPVDSALPGALWSPLPVQGSPVLDLVVLGGWITASLVLLANVRLSWWTIRRNQRSWRTATVGGRSVTVAVGFGPGVIGARRPRIVFPEWALDSEPRLRRLILRHEIEHVRAADTALLLGAVITVSLLPWCLPLWWQLSRLRAAIEADCDARVVARTGDRRAYAAALVTVAGRPSVAPLPVAGLTPAGGTLERRIRLLTAPCTRSVKAGSLGVLLALVVVAGVALLPGPGVPALGTGEGAEEAARPPSATVILSVEE